MWTILLLGILAIFTGTVNSVGSGPGANADDPQKALLCYWGTWSFYKAEAGNDENTDAKFDTTNIDPHLCTHLIYSFAGLNNVTNRIGSLDPNLDFSPGECETMENGVELCGIHGMLQKTVLLRQQNPNLRVLIAIGGWGQRSTRFSIMANEPGLRATFIESVVQFLVKHDLDGLDFDWEYPAHPGQGGEVYDKENFVILLKELRTAFNTLETQNNRYYWLTAALGAGPVVVADAYDVPGISESLDFLNIMAYDLKVYVEGEWEMIGHHSPLYPKESEDIGNSSLSISRAIENFIQLGAPPEKIALGVGAYGKTYDITGLQGPPEFYDKVTGPGPAFGFSQEKGTVAYYEICYYLIKQGALEGWSFGFDHEYSVPFAYNSTLWIGYDNEDSAVAKVDFAEKMGLGGMMIWSIDQDDFLNWCGNGWVTPPISGTVKNRMEYYQGQRRRAL